jgi:hypothetical protein
MTTEREAAIVVRTWLEDGATRMPDRILDAVLADLPGVSQRRRRWIPFDVEGRSFGRGWVGVLAVSLMLALVAGSLLVAGGWLRPPAPRILRFPGEAIPLVHGRYVVDEPFPARFSLDVPDGWASSELTTDTASIVDDPAHEQASLVVTFVDALDVDPCDSDRGLTGRFGPLASDLVDALTARGGFDLGTPRAVTLGGAPGFELAVSAPATASACAPAADGFRVWALPQPMTIEAGDRMRVWIVDQVGKRIVVTTWVAAAASLERDVQLAAMVDSMVIGDGSPPAPTPVPEPSGPVAEEAPWPEIENGQALTAGPMYQSFRAYAYDPGGHPMSYDTVVGSLAVPVGWVGTRWGIASADGRPPAATLSWGSIGTIHPDPCHWSDPIEHGGTPVDGEQDALAAALAHGWRSVDRMDAAEGGPHPLPETDRFVLTGRRGFTYEIDLTIPGGVDVSECDDGEYRLWTDPYGIPRTARPGETVRLWVLDLEPGIVVVDAGSLADAPAVDVARLDEARDTLWIGRPGNP